MYFPDTTMANPALSDGSRPVRPLHLLATVFVLGLLIASAARAQQAPAQEAPAQEAPPPAAAVEKILADLQNEDPAVRGLAGVRLKNQSAAALPAVEAAL